MLPVSLSLCDCLIHSYSYHQWFQAEPPVQSQSKMLSGRAGGFRHILILLASTNSLCRLVAARPQIGFRQSENHFPSQREENLFEKQPTQFEANPIMSGIDDLANGARTTAFLIEEGGPAGIDILSQFGQLLGRLLLQRVQDWKWPYWSFTGSVNNQASLRSRGVPASVTSSEASSITFEDVGALLRGSAEILDRNAPRLQAIAAQAGVRGWHNSPKNARIFIVLFKCIKKEFQNLQSSDVFFKSSNNFMQGKQ